MATGPRAVQSPALPASSAVWGQPGEGQPVCPPRAQGQGGASTATSSPTPSQVHVRGPTVYPRPALVQHVLMKAGLLWGSGFCLIPRGRAWGERERRRDASTRRDTAASEYLTGT